MRLWLGLVAAGLTSVVAHVSVTAAASTVTVTAPPGVVQAQGTGLTVTNSVTDALRVASTTPLNGQTTNFNGGAGVITDGGPAWNAAADWTNPAADYAIRGTGTGASIARFAWLTRASSMRAVVSSYNTSVNAGVLLGGDAGGTSGVAAVMTHASGDYQLRIFTLTGSTPSTCGAPVTLGASASNRTITLTYDPVAGTASATASGTATPATSTCSLAAFTGSYAGLYSGAASPARYDNIDASL